MVRSPPLPSIRTIPTSFTSARHGAESGIHGMGARPGHPFSIERPRSASANPAGLAIDPVDTNILYAGTSNRDGSQFSGEATQPPAGLFKSTDGGFSWVRLGSGYPSSAPSNASIFFNRVINIVIVDPANHQTVYLASNSGLFVSTRWRLQLGQGCRPRRRRALPAVGSDLATGARILYAGITGRGVFQSNDGGLTWTSILSGTTPVLANELTTAGTPAVTRSAGKFIVALAPPTSPAAPGGIQVMYATIEGQPLNRPPLATDAPDPVGVFRSIDQGTTWTLQTPHNAGIPPGSGMPLTRRAAIASTWPSIPRLRATG